MKSSNEFASFIKFLKCIFKKYFKVDKYKNKKEVRVKFVHVRLNGH